MRNGSWAAGRPATNCFGHSCQNQRELLDCDESFTAPPHRYQPYPPHKSPAAKQYSGRRHECANPTSPGLHTRALPAQQATCYLGPSATHPLPNTPAAAAEKLAFRPS